MLHRTLRRNTIIELVLKIGSLQFDFPVVQAALSGYSDAPMRLIARRLGATYALHEVVLDKSIVQSPKARRTLLPPPSAEDHPIGGQLMGAEPQMFAEAAAIMAEHGYDVVDINFGCPVKKVLGRCRGGFLLSEPATAIEILRAVRPSSRRRPSTSPWAAGARTATLRTTRPGAPRGAS